MVIVVVVVYVVVVAVVVVLLGAQDGKGAADRFNNHCG